MESILDVNIIMINVKRILHSGRGTKLKNRLEEIRRRRGMTQEELAEALGVSRQTISSLENGRYNGYPVGGSVRYYCR